MTEVNEIANARKRTIGKDSPDLPEGAVRCTDEAVARLLQDNWLQQIQFYNDTRQCIPFSLTGYEVEEIRSESFKCHPVVEGYAWYRGFAIELDDGKVLIFSGWMQPWIEGGAPDPVVYLLGEVSRESVLKFIEAYCSAVTNHIVEARKALKAAEEVEKSKEADTA